MKLVQRTSPLTQRSEGKSNGKKKRGQEKRNLDLQERRPEYRGRGKTSCKSFKSVDTDFFFALPANIKVI